MNMFFMDYFIPADIHVGLVKQYTSPDGETFPVSIYTKQFANVLPGQVVIYHRKVETEFERSVTHNGYIARTFFETGIFAPPCASFERYWLEIKEGLLESIFNVYSASVWLDKISYDAYNEDFSGPLNPDLFFSKYYWNLTTHVDTACLPELECKREVVEQCLRIC